MKAKMINKEHISGRIYEHALSIKKVQNKDSENYGKDFIGGTLDIATDNDGLNIVTINFTYVTPTTSKGAVNATYSTLKDIIENGKTILVDGFENATMVSIDTALGVNEFYTSRNGEETLVCAKRNEGGFVKKVTKLEDDENKRNTFEFDMLINKTNYVEADEEKHIAADYLEVKGAVFNFRNDFLPVTLKVKNSAGMKYFESLDANESNPVFTKVWGNIISETIVSKQEEESAFGEAAVKEYERKIKDWVIVGAAKEPYPFDDEATITEAELKECIQKMEIRRAEVKKRQEEYQASKQNAENAFNTATSTGTTAATGSFNF